MKFKGEKVKKKLVLIGAGDFAEIAYEYFTFDSDYDVTGFCVEKKYLLKDELAKMPVVHYEEIEEIYPPSLYEVFVAIPNSQLNRLRRRFYDDLKSKGYRFATYVSSHAFVWRNVEIGENTFIFENNVIQPFVKVGVNCIVWSGNHIGHGSVIGDHVFLASHAVVSGFCKINDSCFIGVNSTIVDNVEVGRDCVIGAGAIITKDTDIGKIYPGIASGPAKVSSLRYYKIRD